MALHEDLVIPQGKSWVGPMWALLDEDDGPYDMTGKTVKAQVRESPRDAVVLHEWSTALENVEVFTGVEVELSNGSVVETTAIALTLKPSDSTPWSWRVGVYDVEITDGDNVWEVVEPSTVRVASEVTR